MLQREGKFGKVSIRKIDGVTSLCINSSVQGSAFNEPAAAVVDGALSGPGPISFSPYTQGFLISGTQLPYGSCFAAGLGSGIGIVQYLYNFPHSDITCAEIDPVIFDVAVRTFPLIEYYINQGRLNVILEDAKKYLADCTDKFDIGFADAYTGEDHEHVTSYHRLLAEKCGTVTLNIIDTCPGKLTSAVVSEFEKFNKPITFAFKACHPQHFHTNNATSKSNWILTTGKLDWRQLDSFEPFENLQGDSVKYSRHMWANLISHPLVVKAS